MATLAEVSGTQRSLRPLPVHRTWAPVRSSTSPRRSPVRLRQPQTGLQRQRDQRVVSTPLPPTEVRGGQEGFNLLGLEERHLALVEALLRDGQHLRDKLSVLGMTQRRVTEQRPQRGKPGVAAPGTVVAVGLEMLQERRNCLDTEVLVRDTAPWPSSCTVAPGRKLLNVP